MPGVTCFRCNNGGYTTPPTRAQVPEFLDVPNNLVVQKVELCAACRAKAIRENAEAKERSAQRGEAG